MIEGSREEVTKMVMSSYPSRPSWAASKVTYSIMQQDIWILWGRALVLNQSYGIQVHSQIQTEKLVGDINVFY